MHSTSTGNIHICGFKLKPFFAQSFPKGFAQMPLVNKACPCGRFFMTAKPAITYCRACRKGNGMELAFARRKKREKEAKGSHTLKQWHNRIEFQNTLCYWCFRSLTDPDDGLFKGTKDHLVPLSRGGSNFIENIVAACWDCNRRKRNKTATEYTAYLAEHEKQISEVSTLPASMNVFRFPSKPRFTAVIPEIKEAIFHIAQSTTPPPPTDPAERRKMLRQQIATILRKQWSEHELTRIETDLVGLEQSAANPKPIRGRRDKASLADDSQTIEESTEDREAS
jgi:HNH endonuclease